MARWRFSSEVGFRVGCGVMGEPSWRFTMMRSVGVRKPFEIPDGVHRILLSGRRMEWLPSLPAQSWRCHMRLPIWQILILCWSIEFCILVSVSFSVDKHACD